MYLARGQEARAECSHSAVLCMLCSAPRRIGGRINSHVLSHGDLTRTVDLGATFICGAPAS